MAARLPESVKINYMLEKTTKELSEESKGHSDKALELFKEADEMYKKIKDMPRSPERGEALNQVLDKDDEAIRESAKSMELNKQFLNKF